MKFHKYHAQGNDFILINAVDRENEIREKLTPDIIIALCRIKYGVGADGIILITSSKLADLGMILFNSDSSPAELSGNGLRCLALFAADMGLVNSRVISVETPGGIVKLEIVSDNSVRVRMPVPVFDRKKIPMTGDGECIEHPLKFNGRTFKATAVNMGNPHCVIFQSIDREQALKWGRIIEKSKYFPQRVNVEFVEIAAPDLIRITVYERGVGITQSCGSGACAAVSAGVKTGRLKFDHSITVEQPGGISIVTVKQGFSEVILEGEATKVFEGRVEL